MIKYSPVTASILGLFMTTHLHASTGISDVIFDTFASPDKSIATKAKKQNVSDETDESDLIFFYSPDDPRHPKVLRVYRNNPTVVNDLSSRPDITSDPAQAADKTRSGVSPPPLPGKDQRVITVDPSLEQTLATINELKQQQHAQYIEHETRLNTIDARLDQLNRDVKQAIEGSTIAMAMATTPQATDGRNMVGFGAAYFEGKQGLNIGMSTNFGKQNEHTVKLNVGSAGSTTAGAVGYGYSW